MDNITIAKIQKLFRDSKTKGVDQKLGFVGKFYNTAFYGDVYMAYVEYKGKSLPKKGLNIDYIIKDSKQGLIVCVEKKFLPALQHLKILTKDDVNSVKEIKNGLIVDTTLTKNLQNIKYSELGLDK